MKKISRRRLRRDLSEKTSRKGREGAKDTKLSYARLSLYFHDSSCSTIIYQTTTPSLFPLRSLRLCVLCEKNSRRIAPQALAKGFLSAPLRDELRVKSSA
jgi:hypothetical protein